MMRPKTPYSFKRGNVKIDFYGSEFDIIGGDPTIGMWVGSPLIEIRTEISLEGTNVVVFDYISEGLI